MSEAVQEESEVEVVDQDQVEFVDKTSKRPARPRVDQYRFDILADTAKYSSNKLSKDVQDILREVSGSLSWYASVEDPGDVNVEDHDYQRWAKATVEPRCICVWKNGGSELSSSETLMIREACLSALARQERQTVWSNGLGDMYCDTNPYETTWDELAMHDSVMIDTGSEMSFTAKKITYLRFTVSMPDGNGQTWSDLQRYIVTEANKIGWEYNATDFAHSSRFEGSMYRWWITLKYSGEKPKATAEVITPVWEACLTAVNKYQMDHTEALVLLHQGVGSMEIGDQKWEVTPPPPMLYVGDK